MIVVKMKSLVIWTKVLKSLELMIGVTDIDLGNLDSSTGFIQVTNGVNTIKRITSEFSVESLVQSLGTEDETRINTHL